MLTDKNLAVFQMQKNDYTRIEIADAMCLPDSTIHEIAEFNINHYEELEQMDELSQSV
ncbi:hypothetical protein [Companilactobacillus mishanensis]|uniref:hypothetical protein n=1 Tax=Companilactobacillus mishanensis TaxID=2486008 RepID=UPI0012981170|nr:hypothetical protein [Companilactobacillus mishanensis]